MLGYISSTRKKSCYACVKSKRRCDLRYPFCKRCSIKGLDCKYPNSVPRECSKNDIPAEVVIRQTTPDLSVQQASEIYDSVEVTFDIDASLDVPNVDPICFQTYTSSSSSPESLNDLQNDWGTKLPPPPLPWSVPTLTRMLDPQVVVPSFLSQAQVLYVLRTLGGFVPAIAYTGSTSFIHRDLYQTHEPQAFQDCVAISALYLTKTSRNQRILANSIDSKIKALSAEAHTWNLTQLLAAVQALTIYQIIRLFDPSLNLQASAEHQNSLLEVWAAHLWKRFFNEPQPQHTSCYDAWVFQESVRRTVFMSVFTRCAWSSFTRRGLASQVPVLARLPMTKQLEAWGFAREEWNVRTLPTFVEKEELISYADLADNWKLEDDVGVMDPFRKLLLAACRGKEDGRLLA